MKLFMDYKQISIQATAILSLISGNDAESERQRSLRTQEMAFPGVQI